VNRGLKAGVFEMGDPTLSQIPHFPNFFIPGCVLLCVSLLLMSLGV